MQSGFALPSRLTLAATSLMLFAALTGCASSPARVFIGEPTPLAVKAVGRSDKTELQTVEEARLLSGVEGVWRRGNVLTVDTQEGIQYRFVDAGVCDGYYTCRRWSFHGAAQTTANIRQPHPVQYWLIEFSQGEGGYWLAINAVDGSSTLLDTKPTISSDHRLWATGECNEESGDNLKILESDEFGGLVLAAEAGDVRCCEIIGWDGSALKVKSCNLEPDKVFDDRLLRQAEGGWRGKRILLSIPKIP